VRGLYFAPFVFCAEPIKNCNYPKVPFASLSTIIPSLLLAAALAPVKLSAEDLPVGDNTRPSEIPARLFRRAFPQKIKMKQRDRDQRMPDFS
jgi:hypothetical protein